jgi:hypothetical protein
MNKTNPMTLTVSLSDPALNLTVKRVINFLASARASHMSTVSADAIEELYSLLAIAQNQAVGFKEHSQFPDTVPCCPVCGRVTKAHADTYISNPPFNPWQVCQCPDPRAHETDRNDEELWQ